MRCTPYGYCHCRQEATCSYPDCRVGDMLAGADDAPAPVDVDDLAPARGIMLGLLLSAALGVSVWLGWSMAQWWSG